jgi:hypothetical protein
LVLFGGHLLKVDRLQCEKYAPHFNLGGLFLGGLRIFLGGSSLRFLLDVDKIRVTKKTPTRDTARVSEGP